MSEERIATFSGAKIDGKLHHCTVCRRALGKRCLEQDHVGNCKVCDHLSPALKGCDLHRDRDEFNRVHQEIKHQSSDKLVDLTSASPDKDSSDQIDRTTNQCEVSEAGGEENWEQWEGEQGERKLDELWAKDRWEKKKKKSGRWRGHSRTELSGPVPASKSESEDQAIQQGKGGKVGQKGRKAKRK